ncbi:heme exporter protein CcmB [Gammaproteobacteria bacterium]|jgi:heme exporter protein B|nr:heme exporter protein CcmB [Gammaproteobacteria bacterium]MDA8614099.1 heme exporter protein CcmB [Gammaproteobacteria bacterium]MDA8655370.1 heme exporter protein CcmB [Gammaproteobacteria bacterium]MDA8840390.1 heme exporter protein CcmB [Gammaproteobacteria bacterium]MDA9802455.1 heme exporter protein CcmB [Gammaproteobacteria bacterium]
MVRLIKSEIFKLLKKLKSWLGPLLIMILVLIAFPLSIDISQFDLDKFYFSIIVVSILMTSFVATEGMFEEDFEDGSLEQEFLLEKDFYKLALAKIFVFVFLIGIPLALIGAIFSFANGVAFNSFAKVFLILSLSNLLLFNVFAFGNALSINKGAMLGVLSSLPLALPVIILLGSSIRTIQYGDGFISIIALMIGIGLLMSALMPLIISAALKTHID